MAKEWKGNILSIDGQLCASYYTIDTGTWKVLIYGLGSIYPIEKFEFQKDKVKEKDMRRLCEAEVHKHVKPILEATKPDGD